MLCRRRLTKEGVDELQALHARCWCRRADGGPDCGGCRGRGAQCAGLGRRRDADGHRGTNGRDAPALRLKAGTPGVLQVDVGDDGTAEFEFDRSTFDRIQVLAGAGRDQIRIDQVNGAFADEATTLDGGSGNDVLLGGDGNESLRGGSGRDSIDGNRGADTADMGGGNDSFTWDPGDGSDVIEGRGGRDTLVFNGANVDESFPLEANGSRAVFTRNVGNIRMDTGGVETLDLNMLAGFDNFSVGDFLFNTAMNRADVDMSAAGERPRRPDRQCEPRRDGQCGPHHRRRPAGRHRGRRRPGGDASPGAPSPTSSSSPPRAPATPSMSTRPSTP